MSKTPTAEAITVTFQPGIPGWPTEILSRLTNEQIDELQGWIEIFVALNRDE